jgi:hypothetical protein
MAKKNNSEQDVLQNQVLQDQMVNDDGEDDLPEAIVDSDDELNYDSAEDEEDSKVPTDVKTMFTMFKDDLIKQKEADK